MRALHERHPRHPIVADVKTMDAGYHEAEMMYAAGATFVVVMGQAHEHTLREAVRAAREHGGRVMGDVMLCPDKVAMARKMEQMGVDVVIVHTGYDERHAQKGAVAARRPRAGALRRRAPAAGGGRAARSSRRRSCPQLGAPLVVIGAPLAIADDALTPGADRDRLFETIERFVANVKGGQAWPTCRCPRSSTTPRRAKAASSCARSLCPRRPRARSCCACAAVGVCGSDVHTFHNTQSWPASVPVVLGHEFCGEIAALGPGVKGFREGDRVVSETAAEIDQDSPQTRRAVQPRPAPTRLRNARTAAMASYVSVPARCLHRIPTSSRRRWRR